MLFRLFTYFYSAVITIVPNKNPLPAMPTTKYHRYIHLTITRNKRLLLARCKITAFKQHFIVFKRIFSEIFIRYALTATHFIIF